MQGELEAHGVKVFALSKDNVDDAHRHQQRDALSLSLLSDAKSEVIRQYGVEHHKAVEFSTGTFTVLGVPLALMPSLKTMAIPTSILVDENGVIQWIDQADDYRLRSNDARVLAAVREAFPKPFSSAAS